MKCKKILAVLLSMVMVFTALPFSGILMNASAAEGTEMTEEPGNEGEQITDVDDPTYESEKMTYGECLLLVLESSLAMMTGVVAAPVAVAVLSLAFVPMSVFLPISLPISVIVGALASVAGIAGVVLSPAVAGVLYSMGY